MSKALPILLAIIVIIGTIALSHWYRYCPGCKRFNALEPLRLIQSGQPYTMKCRFCKTRFDADKNPEPERKYPPVEPFMTARQRLKQFKLDRQTPEMKERLADARKNKTKTRRKKRGY